MMEWREQSAVNYEDAFSEAQRWIEAVTKKTFGSNNFRSALENGVLLCDLINRIKPGIIKRVNRLSTPIAGLDNLNVFLRACGKLGLKEAQLFHPGDLQDLSSRVTIKRQETSRRLKNVLITLYWLGRTAQNDPLYHGPYLNLKAFEGLLGIALSKALEDSLVSQRGGSSSVRDSGFGDSWYCEREDLFYLRGGRQPRRENSLDSLDSESSRPASISSDTTLKGSSEGCYSDAEGDSIFKMADNKDPLLYRRSLVVTPKTATQFNQFLPTKDKSSGYVPAPLRKKRAERQEDNRRSWVGPQFTEEDGTFTSETRPSTNLQGNGLPQGAPPAPHPERAYQYESGSDSDAERPDPDLVLDDLASRRFHSPSPAPPTNFAVPIGLPEGGVLGGRVGGGGGGTWPRVSASSGTPPRQTSTFLSSSSSALCAPRHASVRVDHGRPTSADSLLRQLWDDSEDEDDEDGYADPVQDDLYARKVGISPQPITSAPYNKFLPKFWTPEEDMHIQKIKLGSQRRPWYRKMQGFRALRKPDGIDGSKSMSDIAVDTASLRQVRYEELQKFREQVKESEDKWQDDLTKWKNRRRSVNSDIVKKKEEREVVEVLTGSSRKSKTFREMQEERENRDTRSSLSSRLSSLTSLDQDVFEEPVPVPRTRTLPTRSYTIDTPCTVEDRPTSRSVAPLREDPPPASLEPNRAISPPTVDKVDTGGLPTASSLSSILKPSSPHPPAAMEISSSPVNTEEDTSAPTPNLLMKAPEARLPWAGRQAKETPSAGLLDEQPQPGSGMPPGVSRVSASLPRSYQRSDSARLTSVVTARPFGTQSTRVTSLPRAFTMDESLRRVNGEPEAASKPLPSIPVLGRYGQVMTSEDEARSSSAQSSNEEEEEEEEGEEEKDEKEEERSGTPTASVSPVGPQMENDPSGPQTKAVSPIPVPVSPTPPKDTNQESFCDMRISLNQKPNSSRDFGFHADWDSTGAHITSIQTGSSAEQCQLQVGDEVLAVSGHKVSDMSYSEWTSSLEDALQQGSLVLDVRRHGKNHWDRDHPSLPFKSHKIINLTSMDHPTLVGGPEKTTVNTTSLDFTSSTSNESAKEVASHPIIDMASNGVNGSFLHKPVTLRNKESEPISLKNLKRRSEFFEQGGSESAISDLAVPSIAPSSTRWSWDPEEERRRQEKWQKEQELLLQEKYKRDQEKLEEEWRKAQQEAVNQDSTHQQEAQISLEVNNSSSSPHSPSSPLSQATPPWEGQEEERSRLEEQERRRQEEERRKREVEERELERLQEERKRREQQEEEEKRIREEEELKWQRKRQEEREEERRRQEEQQRKERERDQEKQRGGDSYGYAQVQPELSMTDRVKSKSTPHLDDVDSPDSRGRYGRPGGMAQRLLEEELRRQQDRKAQGQRAASQLELERRDILNAMRYREPERVTSSGSASWGKKGDSLSQAEAERQQILREMKKKTQLLTDNSWIRQRSTSTTTSREPIDLPGPIRRGDSLDNLDGPRSSWRSSWTPGSTSSIPNYSRPHSAMSTSGGGAGTGSWARPGSSTLPSSYSMSSLRAGGGNPSSSWSQRSSSPTSPSPTTSPEPPAEQHQPSQQQRSRSVSGKKICTLCDSPLGKGAAMIIESLGLCYHLGCFKCIDCRCDLGGSEAGAEVRIRNKQLYCNSCYVRFKSGQPTSM